MENLYQEISGSVVLRRDAIDLEKYEKVRIHPLDQCERILRSNETVPSQFMNAERKKLLLQSNKKLFFFLLERPSTIKKKNAYMHVRVCVKCTDRLPFQAPSSNNELFMCFATAFS